MSEYLSRIMSGTQLEEVDDRPPSWAVKGLIPEGYGLITGKSKIGKSWFILAVLLAVADGRPVLGGIPTGRPRPVLYLALEDSPRRLKSRAKVLLDDGEIPRYFDSVTQVSPGEVEPLINEWLDRHGERCPLVVIDTLAKAKPPRRQGEQPYDHDYRVGSELKALADSHPGTSLLVVHHVKKVEDSDDWMDTTSGTMGLNGAADFTMNLKRSRNETTGLLRVVGRDVTEQELSVTYTDGRWELSGLSMDSARANAERVAVAGKRGEVAQQVIEYVCGAGGPVTPAMVAEAVGVDAKRAINELGRLVRSDAPVRRSSRGQYVGTNP